MMQRLENVSPEEMNEVVRVASELQEKDRQAELRREEAADHARSTAAAAEEVGLPKEYLERAAEVVHTRRIERVKRARKGKWTVAGIVAALGAGAFLATQALKPPPPAFKVVDSPQSYQIDVNADSRATFETREVAGKQAFVVKVERFVPGTNGDYHVNLNTKEAPRSLAGYKSARFWVRGTGLRTVRLYLENDTERWRSPAIQVSGEWAEQKLKLDQFDHQTRRTPSDRWRVVSKSSPGQVERFSFKLGTFVNEASAKGEVAISDLRFEPE